MAEERAFKVKVISPDRIFYEGEAVMLELTTTEGEIGIYKNHVPMTYIVAPGVMTVTETDGKKEAALHSGFIQILQDEVTVLAEVVEWPEEIDEKRAEEARIRAQRRLEANDPTLNPQRAEAALLRSLARLEVASHRRK